MSMEDFFEAWVETIMTRVARQCGGILKVGRRRETVVPLHWEPPYLGSQKSIIPDILLEREETTVCRRQIQGSLGGYADARGRKAEGRYTDKEDQQHSTRPGRFGKC